MENQPQLAVLKAGGGDVATKLLANNMNLSALRTNALLTRDEWKTFDDAIIGVTREELRAVADVINAGLTYQITNALASTSLHWEMSGDTKGAEISMSGKSESANDRPTFTEASMPLPLTHKDWFLNIRTIEAVRSGRSQLDTFLAEAAARAIAVSQEDTLFNGVSVGGQNGNIPGYRNFEHRNTRVGVNWETATGQEIVDDILRTIDILIALNFTEPFTFYVTYKAMSHLGTDFKAASDKTILQRVREIPGVGAINPSTRMKAGETITLQMSRQVLDMVIGLQPTTVQWETAGGLETHFKVLSMMWPRLKTDQTGRSGIVHAAATEPTGGTSKT